MAAPRFERSLPVLIAGVLLLFGTAIVAVVVAPRYIDNSWQTPSCDYQRQMYEVADPHLFITGNAHSDAQMEFVRRVAAGYTLFSFEESEMQRFWAPPELEGYITRYDIPSLILTSRLLLLRPPTSEVEKEVQAFQTHLQTEWVEKHPNWHQEELSKPQYVILELYDPKKEELFITAETDGILECWAAHPFQLIGDRPSYLQENEGALYAKNPEEYRKNGQPVSSVKELQKAGFLSREALIARGEEIYKIEGCWYCHTDQSRTLVQDCVVNGSSDFPAPPSSAHEYIYQGVSFPGTRRIGPDLARVGIKQPSRDWHRGHFWAPQSKLAGSIMPSYHQFFSTKEERNGKPYGLTNSDFEAIYQYLMTKGTRITPPERAWWIGQDPFSTLEIIEGKIK